MKNMRQSINEFLDEVKEAFPEWLKDKKKEVKDILSELEEHIWDKAEELSDTGNPTEESVRMAIAHLGSPKSIAKEYKRRGTPHVYITKELWPLYKKVLIILFSILVVINVITLIVNLVIGNFGDALNFGGYFLGYFAIFTIVTIIFVVLSMEGYFPEDFKSEKELKKEAKAIEKAKKEGIPTSKITGKPLKPLVKPVEKIIGGIFSFIIGILFIIQPIPGLFSLFDPEFRILLIIFGILIIIDGGMTLIRGVIGNQYFLVHQILEVFTIVLKVAAIPVLVILLNRPEIFPIPYLPSWGDSALINIGISPEYYIIYRTIVAIVIAVLATKNL
ncbi:MAG: permease prefix domain 1-containing protein [Candidatus Lokiarchaeota archaeon]